MLDNNADKNLVKYLFIIAISLIILNIIDLILKHPSWHIYRFINVNEEANFAAWFSSIILAIAALYAYGCSLIKRTDQNERRIWQIISIGLLLMSCDEVALIHESLGQLLNKYIIKSTAIKHSEWIAIIGPFVLVTILYFAYRTELILNKLPKAKKYFITGMIIFLLGSFGLEATINFIDYRQQEILWRIEYILEELFEMVGVIVIIKGIREYYRYLEKGAQIENI